MKENILPFIKKYPMSILLAIIALNLFSIGGSLKNEAELNRQKLACLEYYSKKIDNEEFKKRLKINSKSVFAHPYFTKVLGVNNT